MEKDFWIWFKDNQELFLNLDNIDDDIRDSNLDKLLNELHRYSNSLFFLIGNHPNGQNEIIITAEGNPDMFCMVERLVSAAPVIENWVVLAFKQPANEHFVTKYNGLELDPNEIWFEPLQSAKNSSDLGLRLYLAEYDEIRHDDYINSLYCVLENALGELSLAKDIAYIDVFKLPVDFNRLVPFNELKEFIMWRNNR